MSRFRRIRARSAVWLLALVGAGWAVLVAGGSTALLAVATLAAALLVPLGIGAGLQWVMGEHRVPDYVAWVGAVTLTLAWRLAVASPSQLYSMNGLTSLWAVLFIGRGIDLGIRSVLELRDRTRVASAVEHGGTEA